MVKTGDRVRLQDTGAVRCLHELFPENCPAPGSLGTVAEGADTENICWVKWDALGADQPKAAAKSWLEVVDKEELPNITATVRITRNKERTRVEVDGQCGEILLALAFATATLIRENTPTNETQDFLLNFFNRALYASLNLPQSYGEANRTPMDGVLQAMSKALDSTVDKLGKELFQ